MRITKSPRPFIFLNVCQPIVSVPQLPVRTSLCQLLEFKYLRWQGTPKESKERSLITFLNDASHFAICTGQPATVAVELVKISCAAQSLVSANASLTSAVARARDGSAVVSRCAKLFSK